MSFEGPFDGTEDAGAPDADAPPDAEATARELAKLSKLKYDQRREDEAKRLSVRVKTLDDAVRRYQGEEEAKETSLLFTSVEPSTEPVDGAGLLEDIAETLRRFVVLPDHAAETVALWTMFAWAFDAWSIAPMIQISAPERACGKTRLLEVIGVLVPKPLPTGSISTISREVRRNGGSARYRAAASDQAAWDRALRPKSCKLACHTSLREG